MVTMSNHTTFIPNIWTQALLHRHISMANALHQSLKLDTLQDWLREYAENELAFTLASIQMLGYRAVLRDDIYCLEQQKVLHS